MRIDKPEFIGRRVLDDVALGELVPLIDWSPSFSTWELKGKYPRIFDDPTVGPQARELYDDARRLLDRIAREKRLTARAVYGFWPAAADDVDVVLYPDEGRVHELLRFHMLRQQWERRGQSDFRSLADYVAPIDGGRRDYVGAFGVTTGHGIESLCAEFDARHDDYQSIMAKALADRWATSSLELINSQSTKPSMNFVPYLVSPTELIM